MTTPPPITLEEGKTNGGREMGDFVYGDRGVWSLNKREGEGEEEPGPEAQGEEGEAGRQRGLSWFGLVLIGQLSLAVEPSSQHLPRRCVGCGSLVLAADSASPSPVEWTVYLPRHWGDRRTSLVLGMAYERPLSSALPCG